MSAGPFRLTHYDHSTYPLTSGVALPLPLKKTCYGIVIANNESATHLQVSFDGGAHFLDIQDQQTIVIDNIIVGANKLVLQSSKTSHDYSLVTKEG